MRRKKKEFGCRSNISGVYIITNLVNNKCLIGASTNCIYRMSIHKSQLKHNKHYNPHLQNSVNENGLENFTFEILEQYEPEFIYSFENYWCNLLNTHNKNLGYNIASTSPKGPGKASDYNKKRSREINTGKLKPEFYKAILQFDKQGNFIREFESRTAAAKHCNILKTAIANAVNGNAKTAGGFIWVDI